MNFATLYRVSFYAMLVLASLVLSVDADENPLAIFYPVVVAGAAVVAFVTVDKDSDLAVSDLLLNLLALGSMGLLLAEYLWNPDLLILALGHWLIYLQLILMFRRKSVLEDWELFLLGLVEVLVGTVISQTDTVGIMLFGWAVLALWVLGLFSLRREAFRARGTGRDRAVAGAGAEELYPGLLDPPFLVSALRVTLTTLALGGVIFLAMPRRASMARSRGVDAAGQHLTGFDEEVQLGQLGEILENDTVVMNVEAYDEKGNKVALPGEPLWRGVTMARYESGRWFRQQRQPGSFPIQMPIGPYRRDPKKARGVVRQAIKLESNDSNVLFGLRPMFDATSPRRSTPDLNARDGTITRNDTRPGTYDYEVRSFVDAQVPQPGEGRPHPNPKVTHLLDVPDQSLVRLRALAEKVIEGSVPLEKRDDRAEKARALEGYLRDSGQFTYTLKLAVVDPNLDPVEDFLVNRKEGHCEYFASALTLLLRSVGVPARMVNGFKGGDWNEIAQVMSVRQKHAHSWVEAYLGDDTSADRFPLWVTLDPTPGLERDESVARVSGFRQNFRPFTDLIRYVWVFYVVGYNADRQNRLLYQPIRDLMDEASRGFGIMWKASLRGYAWVLGMLHFETTGSLVSPRGFSVSLVGLALLVAVVRAAVWAVRRVLRWVRGHDNGLETLPVGASHYRRLATLLSGYGLDRPPTETQDEFARRATSFLTGRGSATEAVADVPLLVVDAFYHVRFGHRDLSPSAVARLEARLDALESTLAASEA